ncbi:hypothetical protein BN1723_012315, partial [Verticillium longisporum]
LGHLQNRPAARSSGPGNHVLYRNLTQSLWRFTIAHPSESYPELAQRQVEDAYNAPSDGPNAVTWGVFPGKEIVQPTIVEGISFVAWKDEAFRLGLDWAHCFEQSSPSRVLVELNNDFHQQREIFDLFEGLSVKEYDDIKPVAKDVAPDAVSAPTNGTTNGIAQALPWKQSLGLGRREEDVRPIFWKGRNKSYILRTQDWDEFPNGRWGDSRSPAFGELDAYGIGLTGTNEQNIKKWGEPQTVQDIATLFVRYLRNEIDCLPWSESPLTNEADPIREDLIALNKRGIITINSQPAVNGVKSSHAVHGWGPKNVGYFKCGEEAM